MAQHEAATASRWWRKKTWYWILGVSLVLWAGASPMMEDPRDEPAASVLLIHDLAMLGTIASVLMLLAIAWRARRG